MMCIAFLIHWSCFLCRSPRHGPSLWRVEIYGMVGNCSLVMLLSVITYCPLQQHLVHSPSEEGRSSCWNVNNKWEEGYNLVNLYNLLVTISTDESIQRQQTRLLNNNIEGLAERAERPDGWHCTPNAAKKQWKDQVAADISPGASTVTPCRAIAANMTAERSAWWGLWCGMTSACTAGRQLLTLRLSAVLGGGCGMTSACTAGQQPLTWRLSVVLGGGCGMTSLASSDVVEILASADIQIPRASMV